MAGLDAEAGNLGGETAADATTAGPPALAGAAGVDALATGEAAVGEAAVGEATVGALAVALDALAGLAGEPTAEADEAGGLALLAGAAATADIVAVAGLTEAAAEDALAAAADATPDAAGATGALAAAPGVAAGFAALAGVPTGSVGARVPLATGAAAPVPPGAGGFSCRRESSVMFLESSATRSLASRV